MAKTVVKVSVVQLYNTYSPCDSQLCMGNMLQEEGYWSCPPDYHMQSDHHRQVQVHGYNNPILIKL